ncbi:hypothetical protein M422DRAFT_44516 [Sphaerobolus stellatus SS14]|nr:hypothetical protein M422DRAFT_44516 [Sphaerobolus stellatus SS14]
MALLAKQTTQGSISQRAIRQWRFLLMMKRAARGHNSGGTEDTANGELAVLYPACPIPDVNLPDGWKDSSKDSQFLHNLTVAVDANFRLKRKLVSSEAADHPLAPGKAYFVPSAAYKEHIGVHADDVQSSTCSRLNAVTKANTRDTTGLAVSGTFRRAKDFVFFSAISAVVMSLANVFVSYVIACQWSKNIKKRAAQLPSYLNPIVAVAMLSFLIPKFHLPGHGTPCQAPYSFNLKVGCARTDGEGIERGWSYMNPVGTATKEIGPGSRQDMLEDHWGNMNWTKTVDLCSSMEKKLDWEADHSKPNPYESKTPGLTQADVWKELAVEEDKIAKSGLTSLHEVTPTVFLVTGLELEDLQAHLKSDIKNNSFNTAAQLAKLQEHRTALRRRIDNWCVVQAVYMPGMTALQTEDQRKADEVKPEDIPLLLPSSWRQTAQESGCIQGVVEKEWRLCQAQAEEALHDLRQSLCLRAHMVKYKKRNERWPNTRANGLINSNVTRTRGHTDRYWCAYKALLALDPDRNGWQHCLLPLEDMDVVALKGGLYDLEEKKKSTVANNADTPASTVGEGYRTISWIWRSSGTINEDLTATWSKLQDSMHDAIPKIRIAMNPLMAGTEESLLSGEDEELEEAECNGLALVEEDQEEDGMPRILPLLGEEQEESDVESDNGDVSDCVDE